MFRARLPSIFIPSHKMPRLPGNLHLVATWRSPDNAICKKTRNMTRLKWCACHAKWPWRLPKCCACHATHLLRTTQKYCACHKTTFDTLRNTSECHEVPRLPREPKLRDTGNLQKWPLLQNSPWVRPYGPHTDTCRRLRTVAECRANTPSTPRPPEWNGNIREPLLRIRENTSFKIFQNKEFEHSNSMDHFVKRARHCKSWHHRWSHEQPETFGKALGVAKWHQPLHVMIFCKDYHAPTNIHSIADTATKWR